MEGITARVAEFVLGTTIDAIPARAVARAKELFLDTVGVTLAGSAGRMGEVVAGYARHVGGKRQATVIGRWGLKTSSPNAALANGANAAMLDYDDNSWITVSHPSGVTVPTVLAVGEEVGASGRQVLEAYIVAYEAGARIAVGIQPAQYLAGRHSSGTHGAIMATAAAGRLHGLSVQELATAFGIAASLTGGIRGAFGTMTKPFHSGAAAMNGVMAAQLAKRGLTANGDTFERDNGYCAVTTGGPDRVNYQRIEEALRLEDPVHYFLNPGLGIKMYPTGSAVFCGVDIVRDILAEQPIVPEDVAAIHFRANPLTWDIHRWNGAGEPHTVEQAKYSIKYPLAVTLVDGRCGIRQLEMDRIIDPRVRALMERVTISPHPELATMDDHVYSIAAAEVTLELKDGRHFNRFRRYPRSYPKGEGVTYQEIAAKYQECAEMVLRGDAVERSRRLIESLDALGDLKELITTLVPQRRGQDRMVASRPRRARLGRRAAGRGR